MKKTIVGCFRSEDWRRQVCCVLALALLVAVTLYGRATLANTPRSVRLEVYAFSTQEEVMTQALFPAFEAAWEAETGRDLSIEGVFGPSGTLAGQINLGAPADVAVFSHSQDVTHLRVGRRVRAATEPLLLGYTPMVIVTRPGNPLGLASFADLAQPGLNLLHADPRGSGAGQWAVLAEYGSALDQGAEQAEAQLQAVWRNVRVLAPSARAAMTLFELGAGDALVTYEQDARLARARGVALEIVVPERTIVAQPVAVVVDENVTAAERPVAEAFVRYLVSDAGQQILREYYLRTASGGDEVFPGLPQAFTVEDLGGWPKAYNSLVESLWLGEIEPRLDLLSSPQILDRGE
jgi:sulfate transport system substrate-binding protein